MVEDILASSEFGADAQTGADKVLGQIIDPAADRIGEVYELNQAQYDAWDPDAAEGVQLDNLGALRGVEREPATKSTATVTCGGTPSTVIPNGSRVQVPGGAVFSIAGPITIGGGGTVDGTATAINTGPQEAAAGSITEIVDTVTGWDTVTNAADAAIGRDIESDLAYRLRQAESQSAPGTSTDSALQAALVALDDITAANVISNRELDTDANGTPGKAFLSVIWPDSGVDLARVAETIWTNLPTGIKSWGTDHVFNVTDSQGKTQVIRFDDATQVNIWWEVDVTTEAGYPSNGDQLVEDAILEYGQDLLVGADVDPIKGARFIVDPTLNDFFVPGVKHLVIRVGKVVSPTGTIPVSIAGTEISAHASARVTVNS
jgi:hypothetical protein